MRRIKSCVIMSSFLFALGFIALLPQTVNAKVLEPIGEIGWREYPEVKPGEDVMFTTHGGFYEFTIDEPGIVSVSLSHSSGVLDHAMDISVEKGFESLMRDTFPKGASGTVTTRRVGLAAGYYHLYVEAGSSKLFGPIVEPGEYYTIHLNFTPKNDWEEEAKDVTKSIGLNTTIHGAIQKSLDIDYYSFTLTSGSQVHISFTHDYYDSKDTCWDVAILNKINKTMVRDYVRGNEPSVKALQSVWLEPGTYKVQIRKAYRHATAEYSFQVNTEGAQYQPVDTPGITSGRVVSDWAKEEINRAESCGLIPASLQNTDLRQPINRAEFAAVAVRVYEALAGTKAVPSGINPFTDTNDQEVLKAYGIGTVNGMTATTFEPYTLLNREQCATMLTRVFKRVTIPGWTLNTDSQFRLTFAMPPLFADDALISGYARESVYFMAANKIINGMGNNIFAPRNRTSAEEARHYANATREQAIAIALRMTENLDVKPQGTGEAGNNSMAGSNGNAGNEAKQSIVGRYYFYSEYVFEDESLDVSPTKTHYMEITEENGTYYADMVYTTIETIGSKRALVHQGGNRYGYRDLHPVISEEDIYFLFDGNKLIWSGNHSECIYYREG